MFLFHTANDPGVPVENSLRLAEAYAAAGVGHELHIFADGPHGLGLGWHRPNIRPWTDLLLNWLADWSAPLAGL